MTAPSPAPTQDPLGLHGTQPAWEPLPQDPPSQATAPYVAPPAPLVESPREAATAALAQQAIDRKAVAAQGVDITLRDGRRLDLRYGMAGVVKLEETFGSLTGVAQAFQRIGEGGAVFTAVVNLLGAGLVDHGIDRDMILRDDLLAVERIEEYASAAIEAFDRAFPTPAKSAGEDGGQTTP